MTHRDNDAGNTTAATQHDQNELTTPTQNDGASLAKLVVEAGPLVVFFVANSFAEDLFGVSGHGKIFWATGAFMAATAVALIASKILFRKIPIMPLVSGFFVFVFGGLTLALQDEQFIKIKPTIVNLLFASLLGGGLWFNRPLLRYVLADAFQLSDQGWRLLTIRWAIFFVFLAILNEVVWRNFSTDFWAGFKLFGVMPITMIFAASQVSLLMKHQVNHDQPTTDDL